MKRVLFVCVHNAGRSQMAAAFFKHLSQETGIAESAGTMPAESVHPMVVEAMIEKGIDLSQSLPKHLTLEMAVSFDQIITMGCSAEEACPGSVVPAEDWGLEDPAGKPLVEVRRIRDQIEVKVWNLLWRWGGPLCPDEYPLAQTDRVP